MTDNAALAGKLAALGSDDIYVDGGRVISRRGTPLPIVAILQEIDDTVLNRTLTFTAGQSRVAVVAGGRRLQGLTFATEDIEGADGVVGHVLTADNPDLLQEVARIFRAIGRRNPTLTVRSSSPDELGGQTDAGLGCEALTTAWQIDLSAQPPGPMAGFLEHCGRAISASIQVVNGAATETAGPDAVIASLKTVLDNQVPDFVAERVRLDPAQKNPTLVCIGSVLADNGACGLAVTDTEMAVFAYDADRIDDVFVAWKFLAD